MLNDLRGRRLHGGALVLLLAAALLAAMLVTACDPAHDGEATTGSTPSASTPSASTPSASTPSASTPSASDDRVVARFATPEQGTHEVTVGDIDARILALPPAERPTLGTDLEAWTTELVRAMVVESVLRREAETQALIDDPAFVQARQNAETQIRRQLCIDALLPDPEPVTQSDLEAAYAARSDSFSMPERRFVDHLFLRRTADTTADAVQAEAAALRDRALRGESFVRLATEHSDSESRHQGGEIGWVTRGMLPAGFESVIFALDEGVPSEPLATRDGVHLFSVDQVLPPRTLTLDDVRRQLVDLVVAERRDDALRALEESLEAPADTLVLEREQLAESVEAGDPEATVLRYADTELSLTDLRRAWRDTQRSAETSEGTPAPSLWQVYRGLLRGERIAHHCRTTDAVSADALAERMDAWQADALVRMQRQRRLRELAARNDERLRLFYESNLGDFSKPPEWHLRMVSIPIAESPSDLAARLEAAAARGQVDVDALADREGGTVDDLGFATLGALRQISPKLPTLVAPLRDGALTPPFRVDDSLRVAELVARRPAEPLPFEDVRERVAAVWVEQYTHEAYEELERDILGDGSTIEIDREALAAVREAGQAPSEVGVDELEELFETLWP